MNRLCAVVLMSFLIIGCQGNLQAKAKPAETAREGCGSTAGDELFFDFGVISDRAPVSHEFVLENKGPAEVRITGKTNSCGCTSSEISGETIPPGGSVTVKVTFDPTGYRGSVRQYVYVNTDDPKNPVYRFSIKADVGK